MPAPSPAARVLGLRARALNAAARAQAIPALFFFTDPARTPNPAAIAARLPRGAAIVFRHFGAQDRLATARALRRVADRRGLRLLIGADEALARGVHADGLHLPARRASQLAALRARHPGWLLTVAAHELRPAPSPHGPDAIVLAPILPSRSAAARPPIGARAGAAWARRVNRPVIALGGVTAATAARIRPGFAGLAAIDGLLV